MPGGQRLHRQQIYYRSIQDRGRDCLTVHDYLWRWDTDWFWCSRAFGAQHPLVRRVWPRRSVAATSTTGWSASRTAISVAARIDRWRGRPARERVVQDVEIPVGRTAEFLRWFLDNVPMTPVWLCPLRLRPPAAPAMPDGAAVAAVPAAGRRDYVNVGFWGPCRSSPATPDGDVNRRLEEALTGFEGHKSLYSDAYYDEERSGARYGGETYPRLKERYDPRPACSTSTRRPCGGVDPAGRRITAQRAMDLHAQGDHVVS